jgi:hypothetical protein
MSLWLVLGLLFALPCIVESPYNHLTLHALANMLRTRLHCVRQESEPSKLLNLLHWHRERFQRSVVRDDGIGQDECACGKLEDVRSAWRGRLGSEDDLGEVGGYADIGWRADNFMGLTSRDLANQKG